MAFSRVAPVDLPFAQPRYTPDLRPLSALYTDNGRQLAALDLNQGRIASDFANRLSEIYTGLVQQKHADKDKAAALALHISEKSADEKLKRDEMAERKKERDDAARQRKEDQDRAAAGRLADDVAPGPVSDPGTLSVIDQYAKQFPEFAARFQRSQTLPGTPMSGEMAPPSPVVARIPTGAEARAAALDTTGREREAAAQKERAIDNARADTNTQRAIAAQASTERHQRAMEAAASGQGTSDDAAAIGEAIMRGEQPPETTGLYRLAGPVKAHLAKNGYDLSTANLDWKATQRHLTTLNGAQQTRLRQAIGTAAESLDVIENLSNQWKGGRFPLLNKANLALAKGGAFGKDAASIATQLEGQITDVTSELANAYMGGNSPTDHALQLAAKNLSADWDQKVLGDMIKLAKTNLQIRRNSIEQAGPITASSQAAAAAPAGAGPKEGDVKPIDGFPGTEQTFKNGKWIRTK